MEKSKCIVTCAFREPYVTHSNKQIDVIPFKIPVLSFIDELPYAEGIVTENIVERFQKSLYGFKPHAIQKAIDAGFKLVLWLDPSIAPVSSLFNLFDELYENEMLIVKGDNPINQMTSDRAFEWFGLDKEQTKHINHIGGTIYGFNFNNPKTVECFELWKKAEEEGIFGDQTEFMNGHWADESCMALAMFRTGIEQKQVNLKYINQKDV